MLCHATGDVGVVMLDADAAKVLQLERELGAEVAGVEVVRDGGGRDVEEARHALEGFLEEAEGLEVFEVAEMLAGDREASAGETKGVFLLRAAGQDFRFAAAQTFVDERHLSAKNIIEDKTHFRRSWNCVLDDSAEVKRVRIILRANTASGGLLNSERCPTSDHQCKVQYRLYKRRRPERKHRCEA